MATTTAMAVSPEEHHKRVSLAKALWRIQIGEDISDDTAERQAAFDAVKKEMIRAAIKLDKTLSRLGYTISKNS